MRPEERERRQAVLVLAGAIALGVVVRLLVFRGSGFPSDVATFMAWSQRMAEIGPGRFYEPGYFTDYPPGFLYVLWVVGAVFKGGEVMRLVVKALSIPADIALAIVLFRLVRPYAGPTVAAAAGALWMLQPGPIFAGPFWGQVDAWGTLPYLVALVAAGRGRWATAGALAGVAAMIKPQFGLVGIVIAGGALIELIRYRRSGPIVRVLVAGSIVAIGIALPFGLTPGAFVDLVKSASETYPYTSLFAFNVWSIIGDFWKPDAAYVAIGGALLVLGIIGSVATLWSRRDVAMFFVAGVLVTAAFYFLPTRAHERYIYPALLLLVPFAVARRRILWPYLAFAATFFATLYFAFSSYPQNGLVPPQLLQSTLFSRNGQIAMALAMNGLVLYLAWRLLRGEARLDPDETVARRAATPATRDAEAAGWWRLPVGLGPGRSPTRRDIAFAIFVALTFVATRGFRLDQPRDMYFDEVYHARTAMELLAQRDPYEWTHPHLTKEVMALGILAFGGDEVAAREAGPTGVSAFAVSNDGVRAFADTAGRILVASRNGSPRLLATRPRPALGIAIDGDRVYGTDLFDEFEISIVDGSLRREVKLPGFGTGLLNSAGGRVVVGVDTPSLPWTVADAQRNHYLPWARVLVAESEYGGAVAEELAGIQHTWSFLQDVTFRSDPDFAGFYGAGGALEPPRVAGKATSLAILPQISEQTLFVNIPPEALTTRPDGSQIYVADSGGVVHNIDPSTGQETSRMTGGVGPVSALAYAMGPQRLYAALAGQPNVEWFEQSSGQGATGWSFGGNVPLSNGRTGALTGPITALAEIPRTDFIYALVSDPARAEPVILAGTTARRSDLVVIETHGASPYTAIRVHGTLLGVDGTADDLLVLGDASVEHVPTGRHALAWRIPGVLLGGVLAFFVVLIARRLFASRLVPVLAGAILLLDGSTFAVPRIGMNDVYVGAFLVAGWYFVIAAHAPRRSAAIDLLIAGLLFGLGAASKWVGIYALAGLGLYAVVATAWAWSRGRAGEGGPFDLLAPAPLGRTPWRGGNAAFLLLCFFVLPLLIYLLAYRQWYGGPMAPYGWDLVELTKQMYWYHSGLTSPHPAGSPWWSWPLDLKPVYWYLGQPGAGQTAVIYDAGNIVLFWGALAATVWAAVAAYRARSIALACLIFAFLTQYVAWIPITRVLFFYHFFTALPFYLLVLAAALTALWESGRQRLVVGYLALAAAAFLFFYPFVSGQPVPADGASMFYVLPTWQYDCQFYPSFHCDAGIRGEIPYQAILGRLSIALGVALLGVVILAGLRDGDRLRSILARFGPRRPATE